MSKKRNETLELVWLAGLGALAVTEQEGNDLFQQLVKAGQEFVAAENGKESGELAEIIDLLGRLEAMEAMEGEIEVLHALAHPYLRS